MKKDYQQPHIETIKIEMQYIIALSSTGPSATDQEDPGIRTVAREVTDSGFFEDE
ncbi:MAG: hypothetical protein IJ527_06200 [Prevotella sp.]|nr:hypothetical protein [Prevotella sp.]